MNVDLIVEAVRTIEQARSGDQVAMALIEGVRRSSEEGSPRAKATATIMSEYIRKHPVDSFGADVPVPQELIASIHEPAASLPAIHALQSFPKGKEVAEAALVHGAPLTQSRIDEMARPLRPLERRAFYRGVAHPKVRAKIRINLEFEGWRDVGRCVGIARLVQGFLRGYAPIASFAPNVAWELGEEVSPADEADDDREFRHFVFSVPRSRPVVP